MKNATCVAIIAVTVCLVGYAEALPAPRDSTVRKTEEIPTNVVAVEVKPNGDLTGGATTPKGLVPGRVTCAHSGEEAAEDEDCMVHCIPKGYSYGLCVSNTCSCI